MLVAGKMADKVIARRSARVEPLYNHRGGHTLREKRRSLWSSGKLTKGVGALMADRLLELIGISAVLKNGQKKGSYGYFT